MHSIRHIDTLARRRRLRMGAAGILSAVALGQLAARDARAVDNSWVGSANGQWLTPSNWSTGVPQPAHDVFIDAGRPSASTVSLASSVTINNLLISSGDRLIVT